MEGSAHGLGENQKAERGDDRPQIRESPRGSVHGRDRVEGDGGIDLRGRSVGGRSPDGDRFCALFLGFLFCSLKWG